MSSETPKIYPDLTTSDFWICLNCKTLYTDYFGP